MPTINERGNLILRDQKADFAVQDPRVERTINDYMERREAGRYYYDFELLKGWKQFDTRNDASYFGVWVNLELRMTFSYVEGDRIAVICPTQESFIAELRNMAEFYGDPPPAFKSFDLETGTRTDYYDTRPTGLETVNV